MIFLLTPPCLGDFPASHVWWNQRVTMAHGDAEPPEDDPLNRSTSKFRDRDKDKERAAWRCGWDPKLAPLGLSAHRLNLQKGWSTLVNHLQWDNDNDNDRVLNHRKDVKQWDNDRNYKNASFLSRGIFLARSLQNCSGSFPQSQLFSFHDTLWALVVGRSHLGPVYQSIQ